MTEPELYEIYFQALNTSNGNIEFWLTATFAFVMAFHFSERRFSKYLRGFLTTLYVATVLLFFIRFMNAGLLTRSVVSTIREMGTEIAIQNQSTDLIGFLVMGIMLFGTIGALYYAHTVSKEKRIAHDSESGQI